MFSSAHKLISFLKYSCRFFVCTHKELSQKFTWPTSSMVHSNFERAYGIFVESRGLKRLYRVLRAIELALPAIQAKNSSVHLIRID